MSSIAEIPIFQVQLLHKDMETKQHAWEAARAAKLSPWGDSRRAKSPNSAGFPLPSSPRGEKLCQDAARQVRTSEFKSYQCPDPVVRTEAMGDV